MRKVSGAVAMLLLAVSITACSGNSSTATQSNNAQTDNTQTDNTQTDNAQTDNKQKKPDYPKQAIQIVVPFNAGSNTDTQVRFIQKYLEKQLGVTTAIVNNGGASGIIGTTDFLTRKADGYTVLFSLPTPTVYKPATGETEYKSEDLIPVARVSGAPMYLVVKNDSKFKTGADLIDYIKNNPGKYTYANAGNAGIAHLAFASFLNGEELQATSVPFNGGTADCYTAVMGNHVNSYVAGEQDLAGREDVRALINLGTKSQSEGFTDVPTLGELGYAGYEIDNFSGFYFSKDTSPEIVEALGEAVKNMANDPEFLDAARQQGFILSYAGPEEFSAQITNTTEKIVPVLKALGLTK